MNKPKHAPKPDGDTKVSGTAASVEAPAAKDLGLVERRRSIRPLPVPEAQESDGDSDWAAFQALISEENPK